jgi:23S rRNA maturation-related 3'-5' exoribonuclease YhaM
MIRNITSGYGIQVSGSVYNAPYIDTTRASAGMVRYVGGNLEVYDGSSWLPLQSSYPQVELDGVTQEAVAWTRRKMEEEKRMLELAKTHPTVADALLARDRAEDALKIAMALCNMENK